MRRAVLVLLASTVAVLVATPASAGGNWLNFREEPGSAAAPDGAPDGDRSLGIWAIVSVGQRIVAVGTTWPRSEHRIERLERETFHAWLVRADEVTIGSDGGLPAEAIPLAPFTLRWDRYGTAVARAHFSVPDVPPGEYSVLVCQSPCTLIGFGDWLSGWLRIVRTPAEARLLSRARTQREEIMTLSSRVRGLQTTVEELESDLRRATAQLREASRISRESLVTPSVPAPVQTVSPVRETDVTWWIAGLAALIGLALGLVGTRRRRAAFVVPDTVPDDLVERERAARG